MELESKIIPINICEEMRTAYIDYSMSVIVSRALPDVRDGLKPVHRRVLYSMSELGLTFNKAHKKSARIVGECFVAGTLVQTESGLRPIEKLGIGERVYTQKGLYPITHLYEMPEQELLEIHTHHSPKTVATKGQQYKVLTEDLKLVWKKASELQKGDYLVSRAVQPQQQSPTYMGDLLMDEDLAYFYGFFVADGWVDRDRKRGYHRVSFAGNELQVLEKIQTIIAQKWGIQANITEKIEDFYYLRIHNSAVNAQLIKSLEILEKYASNIEVPSAILEANQSVVAAFLSGVIDGDGSVHTNRNNLNITSISESFVNTLQTILLSWGIFSNIYTTLPSEEKLGKHTAYALEISSRSLQKLASLLNLAHPTKSERLARISESKTTHEKARKIPFLTKHVFTEFSEKHLGGGWYESTSGEKFRSGIKYANGVKIRYAEDMLSEMSLYFDSLHELGILPKLQKMGSVFANLLTEWEEYGISFIEITNIQAAAAQKTYDIQVAEAHEFIANGVLVHNCLGKFHPHGDSSVYDTMVRMAQDWSLRYPLVDGQGNFGSVDGDSPAAMRYTEARLARIANELLSDLDKDTVDFIPNFDDSLEEPSVMPSKLPHLLMNGASGIAVGMATNMLPHNLSELVDGIVAYLHNSDISIDELMQHIKAPDFPTGGTIYGTNGVREAFHTGRGRVVLRGKAEIESVANHEQIIITEIPYQVNKANLIIKIAELVNEKKIEGISDIRDESDRNGMRIVIELRRDANAQVVLSNLYKYSSLQTSFGVNNICLVQGRPQLLNLAQLIKYFVEFRLEVIERRTRYELARAQERAHILQGLLAALDRLDTVIALIRQSKNAEDAKAALMSLDFSKLTAEQSFLTQYPLTNNNLSEEQAKAILEMRLQRLTGLERDKLQAEFKDLISQIADFEHILANESRRYAIIETELLEIKEKYGDVRRTDISAAEGEISLEDMIADEPEVVTISHLGYIKRTPVAEYRTQTRGGKGSKAAETRDEDFIASLLIANTHDYLLVFTEKGRCYWLRVYEIPKGTKTSKGRAVQNLLQMGEDDKIRACIVLENKKLKDQAFLETHFIVFATRQGVIKKTSLEAYSRPRANGINAINIREEDALLEVKLTDGKQHIILASSAGKAIRFDENDIRDMGRSATGVRGMNLGIKDLAIETENADAEDASDDTDADSAQVVAQNQLVGMVCVDANNPQTTLLVISENGMGKRTELDEYRLQSRGGKGIKTIQITEKTGKLISIKSITDKDDLMIINKSGLTIRISGGDIRVIARATQGVRLINIKEEDAIADVALISEAQIMDSTVAADIVELDPNVEPTQVSETTDIADNNPV